MRIRAASLALAVALKASRVASNYLQHNPVILALPLALVAMAHEADAAMAREASLKHLVTVADVVIEGTPEEATSVWEDIPGAGRRIVTYRRVHVDQVVYGENAPKDLWVRTLGGVVGDIGQRVEGEAVLTPGERSMLFLKATSTGPHVIVEMAQGHYLLKQDGGSLKLLPSPFAPTLVRNKKDEAAGLRPARDLLNGKSLTDAIQLIRTERKATGR